MFRKKVQQGNIVIIAIFIVVVMGLLAVNLTRISWSNQDTLSREVLGTQAWFVAHSANEWALATLFPIGQAGTPTQLDTNCDTVNSSSSTAAVALVNGLSCSAPTIQCSKPAASIPDDLKYFQVSTSAICSSGTQFQVQREQQVWVKAIGG
ncbi:hypothetical protein [Vibrio sp. SCSIO 43137]|uniref:hypothetical protein n=1 Tax=Vibrio sp. SCSIO 43137 TaxID=3021011 RepID=UPI00230828EB|nr:hypothetical protein [Vibrio sp. SCSIO 43137]WCE30011.1 hypothetical protein PK654_01530 [Vibrio sp. SCSIO 43137]